MARESRGNNDYYYRKIWKNGTCVSEYVGAGELAGLLERFDRIERAKKEIEKEKQARARREIERIDNDLDLIEAQTNLLIDAFLISRGFYKTKSREWRYGK